MMGLVWCGSSFNRFDDPVAGIQAKACTHPLSPSGAFCETGYRI